MKIDWCDDKWAVLIPYRGGGRDGFSHFVSYGAPSGTQSYAITEAVVEFAPEVGSHVPTKNGYDLFHHHREWRDATWRRLYRKGYRVVPVKIRSA